MAERVPFRGGLTCSCVVESLPWVEKELKLRGLPSPVSIFQLGYRTDVDASAGTHNRGGCVDCDGTPSAAEIDVWRLWGWTMQDRSPYFNFDHCHGWPYKCPHLSPAAQKQEADWDRKDAGLEGDAQVRGRWPVKPWYIALKERKALLEQTQLGVPLMAEATPVKINYDGEQSLEEAGHVAINEQNHSSVVTGSSTGIDLTARIVAEGLQPGEYVDIWWNREWKKNGEDDRNKGGDVFETLIPKPGETRGAAQVRYADKLGKADVGWTPCLRLKYRTNSKTAKIMRRQIHGWKL